MHLFYQLHACKSNISKTFCRQIFWEHTGGSLFICLYYKTSPKGWVSDAISHWNNWLPGCQPYARSQLPQISLLQTAKLRLPLALCPPSGSSIMNTQVQYSYWTQPQWWKPLGTGRILGKHRFLFSLSKTEWQKCTPYSRQQQLSLSSLLYCL